jgi:hypothetical protein
VLGKQGRITDIRKSTCNVDLNITECYKKGNIACISMTTKDHEKGCSCVNPKEELKWRGTQYKDKKPNLTWNE